MKDLIEKVVDEKTPRWVCIAAMVAVVFGMLQLGKYTERFMSKVYGERIPSVKNLRQETANPDELKIYHEDLLQDGREEITLRYKNEMYRTQIGSDGKLKIVQYHIEPEVVIPEKRIPQKLIED